MIRQRKDRDGLRSRSTPAATRSSAVALGQPASGTDRHATGGLLVQASASADAAGYHRLFDFAQALVPGRRCWAVEGAGSYGAGLAAFLLARGERVVEVGRPRRPLRRTGAKSDALDAVRAAREALARRSPAGTPSP